MGVCSSGVSTGLAWVLGLLTRSTPECVCRCDCSGSLSSTVLEILSRQLDRCGPERLAGSRPDCSGVPPPCPACPPAALWAGSALAPWLAGVACGRWSRASAAPAAPSVALSVNVPQVLDGEAPVPPRPLRLLGRARGGGRGQLITA